MESQDYWKKCSSCKSEIGFEATYYVCSVSTCNGKRTGYKFCSVNCFEQHLPTARHKSAGAVEEKSPKKSEMAAKAPAPKGQRRIVRPGQLSQPSNKQVAYSNDEVLVIASRFKEFINQQSEYNTSADVMQALSHHLRHVAMQAIDNARSDGRKTVMARDLRFLEKLNLNIPN